MSELPDGWSCSELGTLADVQWGNTSLTKSSYVTHGYAAFSAAGQDGLLSHFEHEGLGIVLSAIGARCGKCFRAEGRWTAIKNTITIANAAAERDYLFPYLNNEKRWPNKGGAQPFITLAAARSIVVPIPPLSEQRRIVAKIDSLTGKSSRARDRLDHIPRLVEKYKQAVLAAAFRGDLTREWRSQHGIPKNYRAAFFEDVLEDIRYGTAKKCDYNGGTTPVLRIPNVQRGEIILDDLKSASFEPAEFQKLCLRRGDLLIIRSNGSLGLVGRSAIVNDAAAGMLFAGYLIRLRFDLRAVLPRYIHLWLQSGPIRTELEGLAKSTSGVNNINSTQIERLPLQLVSVDEQSEIVRRIETALTWIDRLAAEATSARKLIDRLDQAVLAKAFRGELVPQDPNDEPASVLLERIKAERSATPKVKGRRKS